MVYCAPHNCWDGGGKNNNNKTSSLSAWLEFQSHVRGILMRCHVSSHWGVSSGISRKQEAASVGPGYCLAGASLKWNWIKRWHRWGYVALGLVKDDCCDPWIVYLSILICLPEWMHLVLCNILIINFCVVVLIKKKQNEHKGKTGCLKIRLHQGHLFSLQVKMPLKVSLNIYNIDAFTVNN